MRPVHCEIPNDVSVKLVHLQRTFPQLKTGLILFSFEEVITIQTFLPYPNLTGSAKVLDVRRLGKQRIENLQIMQVLLQHKVINTQRLSPTGEFRVAYFDEYDQEIDLNDLILDVVYYKRVVPITIVVATPESEWRLNPIESTAYISHPAVLMWKGYEHILLQYQNAICDEWTSRNFKDTCKAKTNFLFNNVNHFTNDGYPEWLGNEDLHKSHQSNLLRKHPKYYGRFFHNVPDDLPYIWPVSP